MKNGRAHETNQKKKLAVTVMKWLYCFKMTQNFVRVS